MTYPQGPYGPPPQDPYSTGSPPVSGTPYPQPYSAMPVSPYGVPHQPAYAPPPVGMMPPPAPEARPQLVSAAALLMMFTVVLALTAGSIILGDLGEFAREARSQVVTLSVFCLVIALTFLALTVGVLRGRNGARIGAFVMYGIFMLFNGCAGIFLSAFLTFGDAPWQAHTFTYIMIALFVIDIVVIVLLALGETARWFQSMTAARNAGLLP